LVPTASHVTVPMTGTLAFRVDGTLKATVAVVAGKASYASPALKAGSHTVTATYSPDVPGAVYFTAGVAGTLTKIVVANTVSASTVGLSSTSIYPYRDGWRDSVSVRGTRVEPLAVAITVYSPRGARVRTASYRRAAGAYAWAWNGRTSSGRTLPAGRYKVVQVLADAYGARKSYTSYVTMSAKRMYWHSATITVSAGPRNYQFGSSGVASEISPWTYRSSAPLGMANAFSASAWRAVGYQFSLPSASTYRYLSFQVRGSWSGATGPKIGLIPWSGGSWSTAVYHYTRPRVAMGTSSGSYYAHTISNLGGITSGRTVRAAIDSFASPGGYGPGPFSYSIASVRLVVSYGILK
jgi:hypothetical protein